MRFSWRRVRAMSYEVCILIKVSMSTPKAFSSRRAMQPDKSALPFRRLESVGRETLRAFAAADTERPRGAITSVLINDPGCGGLSMDLDDSRFIRPLVVYCSLRHYSLSTVTSKS
jgi:hypothetical protein